jgi:hypothetical protein
MNNEMIEDIIKFVQSARTARFKPPCSITSMMVTYGIEELSEAELIAEALELSEWLRNKK